jgi:hypothetical protein
MMENLDVRSTTYAIEDDVVARAKQALETGTLKAVADTELSEAVRAHARQVHGERLRTTRGLDLDNPEVMLRAWE